MGSGCGAEVQGLCLCGMGFLQQVPPDLGLGGETNLGVRS